MWWHKKSKPEKPLREQLVEACENVRHQIDVQANTPTYKAGPGISGGTLAIRELQSELAQLEEALANLGPDDA
jgi:hypothetical protein